MQSFWRANDIKPMMILLFDSSRMKHSDVKVVKFSLGGGATCTLINLKFTFLVAGQSNIDVLLRHTHRNFWLSRAIEVDLLHIWKRPKRSPSQELNIWSRSLFLCISASCRLSLILLIHFGPSPVCIIQAHSIAYTLALLYLTGRRRRSPCNFWNLFL